MAIGDFYESCAQISMQGRQTCLNYAYRQTGGADPNNRCELLNDAWQAMVIGGLAPMLGTDVQLQCIYSRQVEVGGAIPDTLNFASQFGTGPTTSYPGNSPFVARIQTDALSSKENGRQFISGIADGFVTDGTLTAAFLGAQWVVYRLTLENTITSVIDPTMVFEPGVISRWTGGVKRLTPIFNATADVSTDGEIYTQRNRRTRRTEIG